MDNFCYMNMDLTRLDLPPSQESLGLELPQSEFDKLCRELFRSGNISSDGELTEVARQEFAKYGLNPESSVVTNQMSACIKSENVPMVATQNDEDAAYLMYAANNSQIIQCSATTGLRPSVENWPGELHYGFRVVPATKSKDAHYSASLNKLFINQNRSVKLMFRVRPEHQVEMLPLGLFIRALVVYTNPDDFPELVKVCYTHSRDSNGDLKSYMAEHLIRCQEPSTSYHQDSASGRHSVMTAIPDLQPGTNEVGLAYKFMDLGSCSGGLNRRDTAVIFTLELGDNVIGRVVLPLRICTCPKRDMEQEEKNREKHNSGNVLTSSSSSSIVGIQANPGGDGKSLVDKRQKFWVLAYGRDNFETLKAVGEALEKKDSGNLKPWQEAMSLQNGTPCKRKRHQTGNKEDTEEKKNVCLPYTPPSI